MISHLSCGDTHINAQLIAAYPFIYLFFRDAPMATLSGMTHGVTRGE